MEKRRCQVENCQGKYYAKGLCVKHYQMNRLQQKEKPSSGAFMETDVASEMPSAKERVCQVPDCRKKYFAKGFCATHYQINRLMASNAASKENKPTPDKERQLIGRFTGMVREVDSLGRIVLPIELRRVMDIEVSDSLEIFVDQEMIIFRKYSPGCIFCGKIVGDTVYFKGKILCKECMNDCKSDS